MHALQQQERVTDTGADLSAVSRINRSTYDRLALAYESSGRARLEQAFRWLEPILGPVEQAPAPLRILELGSADGFLAGHLSSQGHDVTTVEFSSAMAAATRRQAPHALVLEEDFLDVKLDDDFDVVLGSAFVHVLPPPWDVVALKKASTLLKPDGVAYLATTLHTSYSSGFEEKDLGLQRFRTRHTEATFNEVIAKADMLTTKFYVTTDRLSTTAKTWGNWVTRGSVR